MVAFLSGYFYKHPATKKFYYRRIVPSALRSRMGRCEKKYFLRTTDALTAAQVARLYNLYIERKFRQLRMSDDEEVYGEIPAVRVRGHALERGCGIHGHDEYVNLLPAYHGPSVLR